MLRVAITVRGKWNAQAIYGILTSPAYPATIEHRGLGWYIVTYPAIPPVSLEEEQSWLEEAFPRTKMTLRIKD